MSIEETYKYFKSLGAKRYITSDGKEIHCTIAGLPKKSAEKFFYSGYDEKYTVKGEIIKGDFIGAPTIKQMFDKFTNQMFVPSEIAGKNTHYYTFSTDDAYGIKQILKVINILFPIITFYIKNLCIWISN